MKKLKLWAILLVISASFLSSCGSEPASTVTMVPQDQLNTSVAATVAILETRVAGLEQTSTAAPTATLPATPTLATQMPLNQTAQPKNSSLGCLDMMSFVGDVTIPDNVVIPPGTVFRKTWAIKNTGYCKWDKNYSVVFSGGDQLGGAASTPLMQDGFVLPGQIALVTVELVSPDVTGDRTYTGFWKLRNPNGAIFGWGDDGNRSFYVSIRSGNTFSFVDNLCSAVWSNNDGLMYCPSKDKDPNGYFKQEKSPGLENGLTGGYSLVMVPPQRDNGVIRAKFAPIKVPSGSHIRGLIGCGYGEENCNFKATIYASVPGNEDQVLGVWTETYDGLNAEIGIPLNRFGLVGQQVRFTFEIETNGGPQGDVAIWQGIYLGE
ncbi:MAG: hypothetical protein HPY59_08070 [Anaerolineae bacterium]|nr:hypothetical protein [Anaerolineae bacterium]